MKSNNQWDSIKLELINGNHDSQSLILQYERLFAQLSTSNPPNLGLLDLLSIILSKLTKHAKAQKIDFDINPQLYQYILLNLDSDPVVLTNLVNKMIGFLKLTNKDELKNWLNQWISSDVNSKLYLNLVELLVKNVDLSVNIMDSLIDTLYHNLSSTALANSSSKVLIAVYKNLYKFNGDCFEIWNPKVFQYLISGAHSEKLQVYFLPQLFKIDKSYVQRFLTHNLLHQIPEISEEKRLLLLVAVLKIGEEISIDSSSVVSLSFLENLLKNYNLLIRLKALALICYSSKSTLSIPDSTYNILKQNSCQIIKDLDSDNTRNEFVNTISAFIIRVRDSSYNNRKKKQNELVGNAEGFMKWLCDFIKSILSTNSSYNEIIASLMILMKIDAASIVSSKDNQLAFPFELTIFDTEMLRSLLGRVHSNYSDIRDLSCQIFSQCQIGEIASLVSLPFEKDRMVLKSIDLCRSLKSRRSDGGANFFKVLTLLYLRRASTDKILDLFTVLFKTLTESMLEGPKARIHGIFSAMRVMIESLLSGYFHKCTEYQLWSLKFKVILSLLRKSWEDISSSLSNETSDSDENSNIDINYSWRYIKESTLLTSKIFAVNSLHWKFLTKEEYYLQTEVFVKQISSIRHKGALASLYSPFVEMIGYSYTNESTRNYPQELLKSTLDLVKNSKQLITRRSGGLPSLILAVLNGMKKSETDLVLKVLTETVAVPIGTDINRMDLPQVNAMNCLKAVMDDANLNEEVIKYVGICLKLCMINFKSSNWSMRNCALMLFTSLQHKIFNSGRSILSVYFFSVYDLRTHILEYMQLEEIQVIVPTLTILSHLDFNGDLVTLKEFEPMLISLLGNKSWKVREMTARTLSSILLPRDRKSFIIELISSLGSKDDNYNHGCFLAIFELMKVSQLQNMEEYLLPLITFSKWSTIKVYVDILTYIKIEEPYKNFLSNLLVSNLSEKDLNGIRRLAVKNILSYLLITESKENISDIIELVLLSRNFDLCIVVLDFLKDHPHYINVPSLLTYLQNNPENIVKESVLKVLAQSSDVIKPQDLFIQSKSIAKKSSTTLLVISNHVDFMDVYDKLVTLLKSELVDDRLRCMIILQNSQHTGDKGLLLKMILNLKLLTDEDARVRLMASQWLSKIIHMDYIVAPYQLIDQALSYISEVFDDSLIKGVLLSEANVVLSSCIIQLNQFRDNELDDTLLFDIETENEYRDNCLIMDKIIELLIKCKPTVEEYEEVKNISEAYTGKLREFIKLLGYDGPMGYTSEFTVFESIYQILAFARLVTNENERLTTKKYLNQYDIHYALQKLV